MAKKDDVKGDGIAYDKVFAAPKYTNTQFSQCVVHVRPHKKWKGEDFGFDWMRIDDSKISTDTKYHKITGKYYRPNNQIYRGVNDPSKDATFKNDAGIFTDLRQAYFPIQYRIAWKPDTSNKYSGNNIWKNNGELEKMWYYVPIITLKKNVTANLQLIVELANKKKPPKLIYLREQCDEADRVLQFSDNLKPKNGRYDLTLTCLDDINNNIRYLDIIAIYPKIVDDEEEYEETLCGQLRVHPHRNIHNNLNILFVNVRTNISSNATAAPKTGSFIANELRSLEWIINQPLLGYTTVVTPPITLTINSRANATNLVNAANNQLMKFSKNGSFVAENTPGAGILEACLLNLKTTHPAYYNDHTTLKIFIFGQENTDCAGYSMPPYASAVLFANRREGTLVHELLHNMTLPHTFYSMQDYVFKKEGTHNIMDYSSTRISTSFFQWEKLWSFTEDLNQGRITNTFVGDQEAEIIRLRQEAQAAEQAAILAEAEAERLRLAAELKEAEALALRLDAAEAANEADRLKLEADAAKADADAAILRTDAQRAASDATTLRADADAKAAAIVGL